MASGLLHYRRAILGKDIDVRSDLGDGLPVVVPVTTFQNILRMCNALDEQAISMFAETALDAGSVRVENVDCVLKELGPGECRVIKIGH
jgi:hypothetical protein